MTTNSASQRLGYRVMRHDGPNGGFDHLTIEVFDRDQAHNWWTPDVMVAITWQKDHDKPAIEEGDLHSHWYGCHMEVRVDNWEKMKAAYHIAKRVGQGLISWNTCPLQVLRKLNAIKATQLVPDMRCGLWVRPEDVFPDYFHRYLDDYRVMGRGSCHLSAMASDEDEARRLMRQQWDEATSPLIKDQRWFDTWVEHEEPVFVDTNARMPDTRSASEIVRS